jgi:negative regulator of flagellin synthesis FlgM
MRIDLSQLTSSQIANEQGTKKVSGQPAGSVDSTESEDRTTLSSDSSSVSSLVSKAMSTPEIRQELVTQLKQSVGSGQYSVDANAIASSMLNEHA